MKKFLLALCILLFPLHSAVTISSMDDPRNIDWGPNHNNQEENQPTILIKPLAWEIPLGAFIIFVVVSFLLSFYYYLRKNTLLAIKHFRRGGIAIGIFILAIVLFLFCIMFYSLVLSRFF